MTSYKHASLFGAGVGAATNVAAYFISPAMMGPINFTISHFFASALANVIAGTAGTAVALGLGYALPLLASIAAGALIAITMKAIYDYFSSKGPSAGESTSIAEAEDVSDDQQGKTPMSIIQI
jgi:hypothetical protein